MPRILAVGAPPSWLLSAFPSRRLGWVLWLELLHSLALVAAGFPVALIIRLIVDRRALGVASAAAILAMTWGLASSWWILRNTPVFRDTVVEVVTLIDYCEFLLMLPLLTWALRHVLLPNYRWSGP